MRKLHVVDSDESRGDEGQHNMLTENFYKLGDKASNKFIQQAETTETKLFVI